MDAQATRIQAERLAILGDTGTERIRLQTGLGLGASVGIANAAGTRRVGISSSLHHAGAGAGADDVGGVVVWRDQTTAAGFFGLGRGPGGTQPLAKVLVLYDDAGQDRVVLSVAEDGTPSMQMLDASGNVTWRAQ